MSDNRQVIPIGTDAATIITVPERMDGVVISLRDDRGDIFLTIASHEEAEALAGALAEAVQQIRRVRARPKPGPPR